MGTFTPYKESIFSENMKRVTFRDTDLAGVTVKVIVSILWESTAVQNVEDIEYDVKIPDSGEISFDVAEMLRPFRAADRRPVADIYFGGQAPVVSITVRDTGQEYAWSKALVIGGVDESVDAEMVRLHQFFTARPQIDETVPGLPQLLTVSLDGQIDGYSYTEKQLMVRIHFRSHAPIEVLHSTVRKYRGTGQLRATYSHSYTDVSYGTVRALADEEGIEDEIVAYDLWGVLSFEEDDGSETVYSNVPYPQRFIVRRARAGWSYFMFLNGLDGVDTLIARGQARDMVEGETVTSVNRDVEAEVVNDARRYREVNTGYIRSREYRDLWFEFFRSPLRAVADLEGNIRDIVVDEYTAEYNDTGEVISFTFKYHLSERELPVMAVRGEITRPVEEDTVPAGERFAISVSPEVFHVPVDGGSVGLSVVSSAKWSAAVSDEDGMGVSVSEDEGAAGDAAVTVSVSGRAARVDQSASVAFTDLWGNVAGLQVKRAGWRLCECGFADVVLTGAERSVVQMCVTNAEAVKVICSGLSGRLDSGKVQVEGEGPVVLSGAGTVSVDVCGEVEGAKEVEISMDFGAGYAGVSGKVTVVAVFGDEEVTAGEFSVAEDRAFGPVVIDSISWPDIPASGGTVQPVLEYHQDWGWNGATSGGGTITSGADVVYMADGSPAGSGEVTAASKGTSVSGRSAVKQMQVTVSLNGKSATSSKVMVCQAANAVESVTPEIVTNYVGGMGAETAPLSAGSGGGSYGLEVTLRKVSAYSSGSTVSEVTYMGQNPGLFEQVVGCESEWLAIGYFYASPDIVTFTWQSRGTVAGEKRCSYIELDWEGVHKEIPVWQAANAVESTVADIVLSPSKGDDINDILPASGYSGGLSCNITVKDTYTSGSVDSYTPTPSGPNDTSHLAMLSSSASWLHVNDTISGNGGTCPMSADGRGTVEGSERSAVITATYRGSRGTVTVWQEENYPSYTYEIEIGFYDGDSGIGSESNPVPASGGSVGLSVDVHVQHNFPSGAVTSGEETPSAGFWQTAELAGWMTGQLVGDVYGITVAANTGAARSGTVLFKRGGAIGTMTIYQAGVTGGSYELKFYSNDGARTATIVTQVSGMPLLEAMNAIGSGDWFGDFTYEEASEIVEQVMATGHYVEMREKS